VHVLGIAHRRAGSTNGDGRDLARPFSEMSF